MSPDPTSHREAADVPVGHECVFLASEHDAHIDCMLPGRVKIRVVPCRETGHGVNKEQAVLGT